MTDHITIPRALLEQWKQTVNTLAALSLKAERHEVGAKLKQSMADELAKPDEDATATGGSMTTITIEQIHKFLLGEAPLDGVWFGDKHPTERGAFWWRKYLSAELAKQATPAWHDAPTEPGLWACVNSDGHRLFQEIASSGLKWVAQDGDRWYGPIPQDSKAEGRKE